MMAIKYTRLISENRFGRFEYVRRIKNRLPLAFLKQQIYLVALILCSLILLILTTLFTTDIDYDLIREIKAKEIEYGVIVDCGSSGTRAHIFKWTRDAQKITNIDLLRDGYNKPLSKHLEPGLSSLRDDPDRASDYMEPIMKYITDIVPSDNHVSTPIYFLATAGMRMLDSSVQNKILSDITRDLRRKFSFPQIKSQVITGEYEGVYSWLSLNIERVYNQSWESSLRSRGMIEVGGASAQVAFELDPEIKRDILANLNGDDAAISAFNKEQINLTLNGNNSINLFTTTFLGLGVNSAREAAIDLLVRDHLSESGQLGVVKEEMNDFEVRIVDPCLPSYASEIVLRPAEVMTDAHRSLGHFITHPDRALKVKLSGAGDLFNCHSLLERVIKTIKSERLNCDDKSTCPMTLLGTKFIPFKHLSFVGLSEMYFTTHEMINSPDNFNKTLIYHEAKRICTTDYNKLLEMYSNNGSVSHEDRILYECFKASWLLTLLETSGFMMPNEYGAFETREVDWTIGAMTVLAKTTSQRTR